MSVLERIRDGHEATGIAALEREVAAAVPRPPDVSGVVDRARAIADRVTSDAGDAVEAVTADAASSVEDARAGAADAAAGAADAIARLGDVATRAGSEFGRSLGRELARAGRELRLEERVPDIARRVREEIAAADVPGMVGRLERERPAGRARLARSLLATAAPRALAPFRAMRSLRPVAALPALPSLPARPALPRPAAPSLELPALPLPGRREKQPSGRRVRILVALILGSLAAAVAVALLDPARGRRRRERAQAKAAEVREAIATRAGPRAGRMGRAAAARRHRSRWAAASMVTDASSALAMSPVGDSLPGAPAPSEPATARGAGDADAPGVATLDGTQVADAEAEAGRPT